MPPRKVAVVSFASTPTDRPRPCSIFSMARTTTSRSTFPATGRDVSGSPIRGTRSRPTVHPPILCCPTPRCCAWIRPDRIAGAWSSDERTLYVADGDAERGDVCQLFAYPVSSYGSAGPRHTLLTFTAADRGIEGLCVDSEGCLIACMGWARGGAGPAIVVISPSGTILETHASPADMPMRCAFGDVGLSTLYVTAADGGLYRCRGTGRRGLARP
jgi:hypothetical protein